MRAGEKLVASDGYEVCLFPFEYLYMSQDEGGDYSHVGTYNIDFLGWNSSGRVYNCPFYAPCTLRCVDIWDSTNNNRVYQSVKKVHLANGRLDYLTIAFAHDNNPIHNVGDIIRQGDLLGHTGTYGNVTGDHTHSCCGQGIYSGYTNRNGHWDLTNRIHYWEATYVNNTQIVRGFNHNWINFNGNINKFPFVLFANKIRERTLKNQ